VAHEASTTTAHAHAPGAGGLRRIVAAGTFRDPTLSAASQAGLVNNLNDGLAWGVFPLLFTRAGLTLGEVGLLVAIYPAVWGVTQIGTGALSDRVGRRRLIVGGMLLQAAALAGIALGADPAGWAMASVALGPAPLVHPTLIAVVADASHPFPPARLGCRRLSLLATAVRRRSGHRRPRGRPLGLAASVRRGWPDCGVRTDRRRAHEAPSAP
jgi:hypothetical protein